jgi:hypothetical protein
MSGPGISVPAFTVADCRPSHWQPSFFTDVTRLTSKTARRGDIAAHTDDPVVTLKVEVTMVTLLLIAAVGSFLLLTAYVLSTHPGTH